MSITTTQTPIKDHARLDRRGKIGIVREFLRSFLDGGRP